MSWVGTWTTSPAPLAEAAFSGQTIRLVAHVSIGGRRVRIRVSNAFGTAPLTIGAARIALRSCGAGIVTDCDRQLEFGGEPSARVAAGSLVVSDAVELDIPDLSDVTVSLFLPGELPSSFGITGHGTSRQTNYISPAGDHTAAAEMPVARSVEPWFFLSAIEVEAPTGTRGLVAFGDSLTDANVSTPDTNNRWPDQIARRLAAGNGGRCPVGIMNQGLGGNRLLHDLTGDSALKRFDRDVLAQPGATHVIMLLGVNDLRNRRGNPIEIPTAAGLIAGYRQIGIRARAAGLKAFVSTVLPYEDETFCVGAWSPEREQKRQAINGWLRTSAARDGAFDGVIDLDKVLRDPSYPSRLLPAYDCGDHLHPSDRGYCAIGDAIDLAVLS